MKGKTKLIVLVDYFLPGYGSGGPVQSVGNLVRAVRDDYDIQVLTRDHDLRQADQYPEDKKRATIADLGVPIRYFPAGILLVPRLARALRRMADPHTVVYFNSFFSRPFSILPYGYLRLIGFRGPIIIAPRGELSPGALSVKGWRKRLFLLFATRSRWYAPVRFHASTEEEKSNVLRVLRGADVGVARVVVATDVAGTTDAGLAEHPPAPRDPFQIAVVARISPVKNHRFLIDLIAEVPGNIHLVFAGLLDDAAYWRACQRSLQQLPSRITWEYVGVLNRESLTRLLTQSHLFVLPTLGENYGHAIREALDVGCPAVISDQTPWRGLLAAGAGADLPLTDREHWITTIASVSEMSEDQYLGMRERARRFSSQLFSAETSIAEHTRMFDQAAEDAAHGRVRPLVNR